MKRFISAPAQRWRLVTFLLCLIMLISMVTPGVVVARKGAIGLTKASYIFYPSLLIFICLSSFFSFLGVISNTNVFWAILVLHAPVLYVMYLLQGIQDALTHSPPPLLPFVPFLAGIGAILTSIIAWICQWKEKR